MSGYEQGWGWLRQQDERREQVGRSVFYAFLCFALALLVASAAVARCEPQGGAPFVLVGSLSAAAPGPKYRKRRRDRRPDPARRQRRANAGSLVAIHIGDADGWRQIAKEREAAVRSAQGMIEQLQQERTQLINTVARGASEALRLDRATRKAQAEADELRGRLDDEQQARKASEEQSGQRIATLLGELHQAGNELAGLRIKLADVSERFEYSERGRKGWRGRALYWERGEGQQGRACPGCAGCQTAKAHALDVCGGSGWCVPGPEIAPLGTAPGGYDAAPPADVPQGAEDALDVAQRQRVSPWIQDPEASCCWMRIVEGGNPRRVGDRVAFIEKTPRVRIRAWTGDTLTDHGWEYGPKGSGGPVVEAKARGYYGYDPQSRAWCDQRLRELGYVLPEDGGAA